MSSDRWEFELPTRVQFGRGRLALLGEVAAEYGKSAMLVGYADRTGLEEIYARAEKLLSQAGVAVPIRLNPRKVDHASLKSIFLEILS